LTIVARGKRGSVPDPKEARAMLALTENAIEAVKTVIWQADAATELSGLRMVAPGGEEEGLELNVAQLPAEDDEVIEERGARIFLEPGAAALLDDKILDATLEYDRVEFTIADQD
jgi:iron-sulfur cluster assembly protein